ncbi:hypothetical protein GCM10027280_61320 [Micromonospora polyrhachis]
MVVEGSDHGLAGAGRHHHQIAVPTMHRAFGGKVVQDFALIAVRPHVDGRDLDAERVGSAAGPFGAQCPPQAQPVPVRLVRLERRIVPVVLERRLEGVHYVRLFQRRYPDVPFQSVHQGCLRQVGRAYVRRTGAAAPTEQPRLGVQPGGPGLVGDLDLRTQLDESVQGSLVRSAQIRGGDHPQPTTPLDQVPDRLLHQAQTMPFDERAEQVRLIGGGELVTDLVPDAGLTFAVDQQRPGVERSGGSYRKADHVRRRGTRHDCCQEVV